MAAQSKAWVCDRNCGFESHRGHICLSLLSFVCCQVEVSATSWSLVRRSPTDCGVSECYREASIMKSPWPTGSCCTMGEKIVFNYSMVKNSKVATVLSLVNGKWGMVKIFFWDTTSCSLLKTYVLKDSTIILTDEEQLNARRRNRVHIREGEEKTRLWERANTIWHYWQGAGQSNVHTV